MICVNDEQFKNISGKIFTILPKRVTILQSLKAHFPMIAVSDRIDMCVNDGYLEKAYFPISVTEEGIDICANDEHP